MWMHISNLFSKFKVLIQLVKKIMLQKKEAEFENFLFPSCFFLVHAVSSFLPTMLLLLTHAQY